MKRNNLPPDDGGINDWGLTYNTDYAVSTRKKETMKDYLFLLSFVLLVILHMN